MNNYAQVNHGLEAEAGVVPDGTAMKAGAPEGCKLCFGNNVDHTGKVRLHLGESRV